MFGLETNKWVKSINFVTCGTELPVALETTRILSVGLCRQGTLSKSRDMFT